MLNAEQIDKVRLTLGSAGWNDVMKPSLAARANEAIKALILSPDERIGELKDVRDDDLRARIRAIEWLLTVFQNEVAIHDHNRRLDELDAANTPPANP